MSRRALPPTPPEDDLAPMRGLVCALIITVLLVLATLGLLRGLALLICSGTSVQA
jgi:hypothetical protein